MARRAFYSFHYDVDVRRTAMVRNIGVIAGERPATDNGWESVKSRSDDVIERWINKEMDGRTCAVVLVGSETAGRKWINYEIITAWKRGMGVVGIHIHGLNDPLTGTSVKGGNPFSVLTFGTRNFSQIVKCYDPDGFDSKARYAWIEKYLDAAIEEAISIRKKY